MSNRVICETLASRDEKDASIKFNDFFYYYSSIFSKLQHNEKYPSYSSCTTAPSGTYLSSCTIVPAVNPSFSPHCFGLHNCARLLLHDSNNSRLCVLIYFCRCGGYFDVFMFNICDVIFVMMFLRPIYAVGRWEHNFFREAFGMPYFLPVIKMQCNIFYFVSLDYVKTYSNIKPTNLAL